ncbi:hypothetical protein N7492_001182 [Penicillium capsulatum]|uniref:Uncharacterized protein n=1 Tax=Penicillium capsulatum TaxID=69766 RepID=A0A9W9LZ72_9EURO|nr:hypothetical protein N7492_001182 [Penicillium capsulatum]
MQFKASLIAALFSGLAVAQTGSASDASTGAASDATTAAATSTAAPSGSGSGSASGSAAAVTGATLAPSDVEALAAVSSLLVPQLPSSVQRQLSSATGIEQQLSIVTPFVSSSSWYSRLPSTLKAQVSSEIAVVTSDLPELAGAAPTGESGSGSGSNTASGSSSTSTGGAAATGVGMGLAGAAGILGVAFAL